MKLEGDKGKIYLRDKEIASTGNWTLSFDDDKENLSDILHHISLAFDLTEPALKFEDPVELATQLGPAFLNALKMHLISVEGSFNKKKNIISISRTKPKEHF